MSLPCMDPHSLLPSTIASPPEMAYATPHAPAAHFELPTNPNHAESCPSHPFSPLDHSSSCAPPSRKRRAIADLTEEFSQFDGWKLNDEVSLDIHSLPQLINGDPIQDLTLFDDDHPHNLPVIGASHKCSDLEDVLNFLWMEDDTASTTQSASSPIASSDHISLISDLEWDYGTNESSSNQAESTNNPSISDNLQSLEVNQEGVIGASYSSEEGSLIYKWESWQEKQRGLMASLQEKRQGAVRASWQDKSRASWQLKQEGARASWQQLPEGGCKQEMAAFSASGKQGVGGCGAPLRTSRSGAWAGPTLLDIESALAVNSVSPHRGRLSSFSLSPIASPTPISVNPKPTITSFFDVKKLLSDDLTKATREQDSLGSSWRLKLQKRSSLEPKYTIKVESEERALGDGYRWRKYGQKTIKNSPFPRSYYRCSTGKCNAKKQVEKCHVDGGAFLVTYEGIHLHHRPNPLHKFRTLTDLNEDEKERSLCSPSSSTSCSYSIPPICTPSNLSHTLLT